MAKLADVVREFCSERSFTRAVTTFALCYFVYLLVLEAFLSVPVFNNDIQIRPASALGPVMGLFFSWPGVLGAAFGNLVSDTLRYGMGEPDLGLYFLIQVVYDAAPYLAWYFLFRRSKSPFPCIDSASKLGAILLLWLLDSILVALLLTPFEEDVLAALNINIVHALNNFIFLVYLGVPLLIALDASPLRPIAPLWVGRRYTQRKRMNLTQRFSMGFILVLGVTVATFIGVSYSPFIIGFDSVFSDVVASIYISATLLTFSAFIPLIFLLGWIERGITKPLDSLIVQSRAFARSLSLQESDRGEGFAGGCNASDAGAAEASGGSGEGLGTPVGGDGSDEPGREDPGEVLTEGAFTGLRPISEMSDLIGSVCLMHEELDAYVDRLAVVTAERERTQAELDIARNIQMGAVPHDFSTSSAGHNVLVEGFMRPAREVGGDFYDVFDAKDGRVAFVIGDVSGKGVPAALFMMRAQSLLREKILACRDLGQAMAQVNDALCDRNEAMLFVTAFICVLDPQTGSVRYANAGHNPPVLLQDGKREYMKVRPGLVLGAMDGMMYREGQIDLGFGDGILLYTDGVTEATDMESTLFGEDRLLRVLEECDADGSAFVAKRIEAAVDAFAGECPQADDITVLSFRRSERADDMRCIDLMPEESELETLFSFLGDLCDHEGCSGKMLPSLMLVAEELFVNMCHYGFEDGRKRMPVSISAVMDDVERKMRLEFSDAGIPYNPLTHNPKKADLADEERAGGLGLLLVRHNVDELTYEYRDGRNILRLVKSYM